MAYSNTPQDFYQTPMGTLVTEPQSAWDTSTHCGNCGVQYIYCGCMNEDLDRSLICAFCSSNYSVCDCDTDEDIPAVDIYAICAVCDYAVNGLFYLNGDSTGRCAGCHNANR